MCIFHLDHLDKLTSKAYDLRRHSATEIIQDHAHVNL